MKNMIILTALLITGCASTQNSPNVVSGDSCPVQKGVVLDVQSVTIERNTDTAQAIGAGVGGYVANNATKDRGEVTRVLATAAGVAAGAVIGDKVADATQDLQGYELIVELPRGVQSIIQQAGAYNYTAGDTVWVVGYPDSRTYSRTNCAGKDVRVLPRKQ